MRNLEASRADAVLADIKAHVSFTAAKADVQSKLIAMHRARALSVSSKAELKTRTDVSRVASLRAALERAALDKVTTESRAEANELEKVAAATAELEAARNVAEMLKQEEQEHKGARSEMCLSVASAKG